MKAKYIVFAVVAAVLAFLVIFPTLYMQSTCGDYIQSAERVRAAADGEDFAEARAVFEEKLGKWDQENGMILAFSQHLATERIKEYVVQLRHSLEEDDRDDALESADLLKTELIHLRDSASPLLENLF